MMEPTMQNTNNTSLGERIYPVLIGFKKAILPDNDVVVNVDNRMFAEKYANILAPDVEFISTDSLESDKTVGTLILINRVNANGENCALLGKSIKRVKIESVIVGEDVPYVTISDYPYQLDCDENTILAYADIINSGIKKLSAMKTADKVLREIPIFDATNPNKWINRFGAAFEKVDTNVIYYAVTTTERLETLAVAIGVMLDQTKLREEIERKVQANIDKGQREYYLREELKVINEELYGGDDEKENYTAQIDSLKAPDSVKDKLKKELTKMVSLQVGSPESFVCRNYLDTVLALPWGKYSEENVDIDSARKILDEDHYGIDDVKERIIEYLAVHAINNYNSTNILCLVGPPGVGKTSIVQSIAKAIGREYVRASLGGVHDEAEIRGHRRTYIGSMPGRIIESIKKAGTMNPVFLLDEIDKLGADYKGDPSNALLEVLDPQQNSTFQDHYLDIPFDLSRVMFITTANSLEGMSRPLLDRMEIIEVGSYTREEKMEIARKFLLPKQLEKHLLTAEHFSISDDAIAKIISLYTREAGVRKLEQFIAKICRKIAVKVVKGEKGIFVSDADIETYLGIPRYVDSDLELDNKVGVAHGLAWSENGGSTLDIECLVLPGKDKRIVTGNLGNVMKESVEIAISNARAYIINVLKQECDLSEKEIHIHAPEGAVPKDGPSAGCAISTAVLSALISKKVRGDFALTGELSLVGDVLPIGGVKEKCLAALRRNITDIILPKGNEKDVSEIPEYLRNKIKFYYVKSIEEVYKLLIL